MTPKQTAFVGEYLVDLNATQAAIRAGYSRASAEVQGCRLLRNDQVRAAVDAALGERQKRVEVTADWVVEKLVANTDHAMSSPSASHRAVANGSLKLLGQHLGMFRDRVELTGLDGAAIEVADRSASLTDVANALRDAGALPADGG